jgi:glycosyltransferase involved in cell wall biosynthesis
VIRQTAKNNLKWISNIHGPWFELFYSESKLSFFSNKFIIFFLRKAFESMERIVFVSSYLYHQSQDIFGKVVLDKGLVIHNGINTSNIKKSSYKLNDGFNILFPGGPKLKKGGDILITAINELVEIIPNLNLYVALEVPEDHLIRRLVKKYGLENNVQFVGFLKPDKYMTLLNSVDILAMPSRMEPFGMVYLEAMAVGVPIIASDVGGATEIIEDYRNGILTSPEPIAVSEAILTLYRDKSLREIISNNNLEDIHKFQWNNIVNDYIEEYNGVIND